VIALGYAAYIVHISDPFDYRGPPSWIPGAVFVGCVTGLVVAAWALRAIMGRVALAGGPQDPEDRYGALALAAVTVLCVAAGWVVQVDSDQ
jgi:hypothetical protein